MSRRSRFHHEEHENLERWLVSYADFITLLFAFFVVMYGISQINAGKYRALSESMVGAFRSTNVNTPGQKAVVDGIPANPAGQMIATPQKLQPPKAAQTPPTPEEVQAEQQRGVAREKMRNMAADIQKAMASLVKEGKVRISEGPQGISVDINASVLFAPGDAQLGPSAVAALQAVARVLANAEYPITVEGHTDNDPIKTAMFPSNWELSVVRASSVVRLFQGNGVAPWRLTAAGYGEQRPVAPNDTPEGRSRNRRVTLTIDALVGPAPVALPIQGIPATTPAAPPAVQTLAPQPGSHTVPGTPITPPTPRSGN